MPCFNQISNPETGKCVSCDDKQYANTRTNKCVPCPHFQGLDGVVSVPRGVTCKDGGIEIQKDYFVPGFYAKGSGVLLGHAAPEAAAAPRRWPLRMR